MARMRKSTRKFEKNHLKDTIERRKDVAKIKQRNSLREKKRAKRAKDEDRGDDDDQQEAAAGSAATAEAFADMTVDEFFQGGFQIPEDPKEETRRTSAGDPRPNETIKKGTKRSRKASQDEDREDTSSVSSLEQTAPPSDSASESESGDDFGMHKGDLEALAERDPEFYAHLKENDPELLEFGDLAEVDELSGSGGDQPAPKKKRKKAKKEVVLDAPDDAVDDDPASDDTEVSSAMVKKWTTAMADQQSLRAMRQVVLAFRAAVHVNEEDGTTYKYSISSPDGALELHNPD